MYGQNNKQGMVKLSQHMPYGHGENGGIAPLLTSVRDTGEYSVTHRRRCYPGKSVPGTQ